MSWPKNANLILIEKEVINVGSQFTSVVVVSQWINRSYATRIYYNFILAWFQEAPKVKIVEIRYCVLIAQDSIIGLHNNNFLWWLLFQSDVTSRKYCPVGKVLPGGVQVYIMNEELTVQPVGVAGEVRQPYCNSIA